MIFGDDYQEEIKDLIDPDNLEQRYGGNLPNITENFFPPAFNPWNTCLRTRSNKIIFHQIA